MTIKEDKKLYDIKYNLISYEGCKYRIVERLDYQYSIIEFSDGYIRKASHNTNKIKNPYFPKVSGVGFIGEGIYRSNTHKKIYKIWNSMLDRCYLGKIPAYSDVTVCKEWHNFQNFAAWMEQKYCHKGWHLDKDLLIKGNKIYSPKTCCFLPPAINSLIGFIHSDLKVTKIKNRYYSRIMMDGKRISLGACATKKESFEKYVVKRTEQSLALLQKYKDVLPTECCIALHKLIDTIESEVSCVEFESTIKRK